MNGHRIPITETRESQEVEGHYPACNIVVDAPLKESEKTASSDSLRQQLISWFVP
jgi:hypothetical protein